MKKLTLSIFALGMFTTPTLAADTCSVTFEGIEYNCDLDLDAATQTINENVDAIDDKIKKQQEFTGTWRPTIRRIADLDENGDVVMIPDLDKNGVQRRDKDDELMFKTKLVEETMTKAIGGNAAASKKNTAVSNKNAHAIDSAILGYKSADSVFDNRIKTNKQNQLHTDTAQNKVIGKNQRAITENAATIQTNAFASVARDEALGQRIDRNSKAIKNAIALSVAIPDSYLSPDANFSFAMGGGFTNGAHAFGAIGTLRFSDNVSAYGGGSAILGGGNSWAAKGGMRLEW